MLLQAVPCIVLAFIAHPSTQHMYLFRVSPHGGVTSYGGVTSCTAQGRLENAGVWGHIPSVSALRAVPSWVASYVQDCATVNMHHSVATTLLTPTRARTHTHTI